MMARYVCGTQDTIDYAPAAAVTAGDVLIVNDLLLIALRDVAAGVEGAFAVSGTYDFAADSGDTFEVGQTVYFNQIDDGIEAIDSGGDAIVAGKIAKAKTSGQTEVRVRVTN
jgi:predicted RecA/RadA family phage recombinase